MNHYYNTYHLRLQNVAHTRCYPCLVRSCQAILFYLVQFPHPETKTLKYLGNGCGSVGRMVASNTRGTQFESSKWRFFIKCQLYWKTKKEKRGQKLPCQIGHTCPVPMEVLCVRCVPLKNRHFLTNQASWLSAIYWSDSPSKRSTNPE